MKKSIIYILLFAGMVCQAQVKTYSVAGDVAAFQAKQQFKVDSIVNLANALNNRVVALTAVNSTQAGTIDVLNATVTALRDKIDSLNDLIKICGMRGPPYGVNIHTFSSPIYSDIDKTVAAVKALGMNAVRVDVQTTNTGVPSNPTKFNELLAKCGAAGIDIYPMVNIDGDDIRTGYDRTYAIGFAFATKYNFQAYEAGNELAIKEITSGTGDKILRSGAGDKASDYDLAGVAKVVAAVKGMVEGIHAARPGSKVIVDESWLHTYYIDALVAGGVNFDILAWHSYTEQYKANGNKSFADLLKSKYPSKTLWFNEVGLRPQSDGSITQESRDNFKKMVIEYKPYGLFIYELFDESNRSGLVESRFGLYDVNFQPKQVVADIR